jgi:hypothetical protein
MLNVIILSVVMLIVVMLSVVVPQKCVQSGRPLASNK